MYCIADIFFASGGYFTTKKEFYGDTRKESETVSDAELSDPDGSRGTSPARCGSSSMAGASASASSSAAAAPEVAEKVNHSKSIVLCVEFLECNSEQHIADSLLSNIIHIHAGGNECTRRQPHSSLYVLELCT